MAGTVVFRFIFKTKRGGNKIKGFEFFYVLCMIGIGVFAGRICRLSAGRMLTREGVSQLPKGIRKPLPEAENGVLWLLTALFCHMGMECVLYGVLASVLFLIATVDFCTLEIPPGLNRCIVVLGVMRIVTDISRWDNYVLGSLLVGGLLFLVYVVTKRRGIGGGDVKLMAAVGLVLGVSEGFFALFIGCLLAVLVQPIRMKLNKKGHVFAMGPYFAAGTLCMVWFGEPLLLWYKML